MEVRRKWPGRFLRVMRRWYNRAGAKGRSGHGEGGCRVGGRGWLFLIADVAPAPKHIIPTDNVRPTARIAYNAI